MFPILKLSWVTERESLLPQGSLYRPPGGIKMSIPSAPSVLDSQFHRGQGLGSHRPCQGEHSLSEGQVFPTERARLC